MGTAPDRQHRNAGPTDGCGIVPVGWLTMNHDADAPWNKYGGTAADVYEPYMVPRVFSPWAELHLQAARPRTVLAELP